MMDGRSELLPPGRLCYGETFPFAALPEHNSYALALLRSWSPHELATRLAGLSVRDFLHGLAQRRDGVIFAAVDQVEDLLVDSGSWTRRMLRRQFLGEVAQAINDEPRLHLLLVTRTEAADLISSTTGSGACYTVAPLTRKEAVEAVVAPAAAAGRSFADATAEKLVLDLLPGRIAADGERYVTEEFVEPALLQAVCSRLWHALPADVTTITAADVRTFGDAGNALAAHCGQVIAAVAAENELGTERVRSWLLGNFITEPGTRGTVHEGTLSAATMPDAVARAVARALVDRHLLTTDVKSGLRWYTLLSDRLIDPLRRVADERPPALAPADYLRAAERALALQEFDLARQYAGQALRAKPDLRLRAEAQSLLGNLAHGREKPAEAEEHYREAASLFEAARETGAAARQLAAVGQTLLAQGRPADAVRELHAAVDRMPNDLVTQTELALALWQLGEGRAAVAILTGVLGIDGGNAEALRARGEILADLGEARDAMRDLDRRTVRYRPSTRAARGLALAELGDHKAASREIDNAMAEAPRNGLVLLYAARACALEGDRASSEELARRAVDATDPPLSPRQREKALRLASTG
jgi:tetratricopeptide (TPR) repeat protein